MKLVPLAAAALTMVVTFSEAHAAMTAAEAQTILFKSQDTNSDGAVTPREFETFRRAAQAAMDADGDARVSAAEWAEFDPGFLSAADETGSRMALMDAKGEVFARYDTSADGYLSNEEMMAGLFRDFLEADENDDGRLDEAESAKTRIVKTFADSLMQ